MDSVTSEHAGRPGNPGSIDVVGLTRALVDIDSTTGREAEIGEFLFRYLEEMIDRAGAGAV